MKQKQYLRMSAYERAVLDVLVHGRALKIYTTDHPIKGLDLLDEAGIPWKREQSAGGLIRDITHSLRNNFEWPLCSRSGTSRTVHLDGYWMAEDMEEKKGVVVNLQSRIKGQIKTIGSMRRAGYVGSYGA